MTNIVRPSTTSCTDKHRPFGEGGGEGGGALGSDLYVEESEASERGQAAAAEAICQRGHALAAVAVDEDAEVTEPRQRAAADHHPQRPPVGEGERQVVVSAQLQPLCISQRRTAHAPRRSQRRRLRVPLPQLRQLLLHRHPQPLGRAAQVHGQERPERVAELVRHDALLVVAQVQEVARRLGRRRRPRLGGAGARRHPYYYMHGVG